MRPWMILGAALVLVVASAAAGQRDGGKPGEPDWQEVVWRKGECVAQMPGKAVPFTQAAKGADQVDVHFMAVDLKTIAYILSYATVPALKGANEETVAKALDNARDGNVGKNKLVKEEKLKHGTYFGRELHIDFQDGTVSRTRLLVVEDKIYTVIVVGPRDVALGKDADRFFESFKLLK